MNLHHPATQYDHDEMRHRVRAQLDTCIAQGVRHVVLGAFGCGAYCNPAARVASLYAEELAKVLDQFEVVVFSVFYPGYGPDNYTPFAAVLAQAGLVRLPPQFGHNPGDWQVVRNPRTAPMALTDPWETDPVRSQWRGQSSHWDGSIPRGAGIICLLPPPAFWPPTDPRGRTFSGWGRSEYVLTDSGSLGSFPQTDVPNSWRVCMVRKARGRRSFPKGGRKRGPSGAFNERVEAAARREWYQETGVNPDHVKILHRLGYLDDSGIGTRLFIAVIRPPHLSGLLPGESAWCPPAEDRDDTDPIVEAMWLQVDRVLHDRQAVSLERQHLLLLALQRVCGRVLISPQGGSRARGPGEGLVDFTLPPVRGGQGRTEGQRRPGDWDCPACRDHQFARNSACRRCGTPKPSTPRGCMIAGARVVLADGTSEEVSSLKAGTRLQVLRAGPLGEVTLSEAPLAAVWRRPIRHGESILRPTVRGRTCQPLPHHLRHGGVTEDHPVWNPATHRYCRPIEVLGWCRFYAHFPSGLGPGETPGPQQGPPETLQDLGSGVYGLTVGAGDVVAYRTTTMGWLAPFSQTHVYTLSLDPPYRGTTPYDTPPRRTAGAATAHPGRRPPRTRGR